MRMAEEIELHLPKLKLTLLSRTGWELGTMG